MLAQAHGAPADLVRYDRDPLVDLSLLDDPAHVVLNGQLVYGS
jgi:imidazolonepropionase-like amidohydrolase